MDFQYEMADLLSRVEGALGVLLLDHDGETVEAMGRTGSIYDIKVLGAYQGIFLARVIAIAADHDLGSCAEFSMRIGRESFLTRVLPEGYYVTLILGDDAILGIARRELARSGEKIAKILF